MSRRSIHARRGAALMISLLACGLAAPLRADEGPKEAKEAPKEEAFLPYDVPPRAIKIFAPEYPSQAQRAHIEGTVDVRMTISESGRVIEAVVHRSDTIPYLDAAALQAAKISLFRPALLAGKPVKARLVFPFPFRMQ
jgi:TonB family protein